MNEIDVDTDGDHAPIADQPRNIIDTVLVDPVIIIRFAA